VLFGTPHSTSEDIEKWQSTTLLLQAGLKSKKKRSVDVEAIERFAHFSLEFEQANVLAPILFVFETQPSKIKVPVVSAKKVLVSWWTPLFRTKAQAILHRSSLVVRKTSTDVTNFS
jgi:hypothetical protein